MAPNYTKEMITKAFIQLLNEKPLHRITIKDIAEDCDINRNTFYYYYPDIYALLSEIFENELQRVIDEYNNTLSWEEGFLLATSFALENKTAIFHVYNSMQREEVTDYIHAVAGNVMTKYVEKISQSVETSQGIKASEEDKEIIAYFYQCALTEMVLGWVATRMKEEPGRIIRRIGLLFDGNIERSLRRSHELNQESF